MLLVTSSPVSLSSSTPKVTLSPVKAFIMRTPCLILRHFTPRALPPSSTSSLSSKPISRTTFTCAHAYPDPIPEFAESETQKFQVELLLKLSEDGGEIGNELHAVVDVCAQVVFHRQASLFRCDCDVNLKSNIFNEFLHKEYGGPGTLLVEPFTDMLVALKKRKLPGAVLAARASLLWAQKYVDKDWEVWNSKPK